MGKIKPGDLRQKITLVKPVTVVVEKKRTTTWVEVATDVPAKKTDVSGREFYQAHAAQAEDIVTFTIRWREGINTTWRVRHGGETYGILEVNHLGEWRDYMVLKTRAVTGGGV